MPSMPGPRSFRRALTIRSSVVLERHCTGIVEADIDQILSDNAGRVFICRTPGEEIVRLLLAQLDVADVIARGLASDLYTLVADASAENATLSFDERRRISTTEVDRRIFERLEAEDPTAIDHVLLSGVLEPVDFTTPVQEPDFYRGVKVKPGHVAAELVLDRPKDVRGVLDALWRRRQVLVSGPSGGGQVGTGMVGSGRRRRSNAMVSGHWKRHCGGCRRKSSGLSVPGAPEIFRP